MFSDRNEAGKALAAALAQENLRSPVILALPRGGVPVAAAIARELGAPLDIVIVRKVGAPGNPELAIAAIVDGNPPDVVLNREIIEAYDLDEGEIARRVSSERPELERRRLAYRGNRQALSVTGKTAVLVDDGAATGASMSVAIRALRRRSPQRIVVALPVAPADVAARLAQEADLVVCLRKPVQFRALGYHYRNFEQLRDEEVLTALGENRRRSAAKSAGPDPSSD
jgi:putative phosphoribosyl transferase